MNFSTECLTYLPLFREVLVHDGMELDALVLELAMHDLHDSVKFLLPSPSHMNVIATAPSLQFMRLPYPVCAFEYSCPEARDEGIAAVLAIGTSKSTRRIALAYDCRKDVGPVPALKKAGMIPKDSKGLLVQSFFYLDKMQVWAPSFAGGYIDEDTIGRSDFRLDNKNLRFDIDAVPLMTQSLRQHFGHLQGKTLTSAILNDVADELSMAVRACLLLNTRNLKVVKAIEAPHKLNKKREKNGKPPFFQYHTLDVFISDTGSRLSRKRVDQNFVREHFAHMNTQKSWSSVIGHFKVRKTGLFYWNSHQRGTKQVGVIEKEYRVREQKG